MENMELVESQSVLKRIYYSYIHGTFLKIKERWLAYFAELAMDDEPSSTDIETEIEGCGEVQPMEGIKPVISGGRKQDEFGSTRFGFLATTLGATFGFGHLWRFPNLAAKYGGGAFLVIYIVFTLLFGYSLYFMELSVGQYTSKNALRVFDRVPLLQGVGFSIVAYGYFLSIYYSQVVGFGLFYFGSSFNFVLPWTRCPPELCLTYNVSQCHSPKFPNPVYIHLDCPNGNVMIDVTKLCARTPAGDAYRGQKYEQCCKKYEVCELFDINKLCRIRHFPSSFYWASKVIPIVENPEKDQLQGPKLTFLLCSFVAWIIIYVFVCAGVKWTGIVSITIIPFIIAAFILMLVVAANIRGSICGVLRLFIPKIQDFYRNEIWYAALSHSFFSLSVAMGPGISLGAVSRFRNPCHIDSLYITLGVVLSSVLTGAVVFCMLGYITELSGTGYFDTGYRLGSGTSIVAYSDIIAKFPVAWLSSAVFFFLFTVVAALSVSFVVISVSAAICEAARIRRKDKCVLNFFLVVSAFLFTVPMIMEGGQHLFSSMDNFTMRLALPIICFFELCAFFIYGLHVLSEDIAFMLGSRPSRFFKFCWIICPLVIIGCTIYKFLNLEWPEKPLWDRITQYVILGVILSPIVLFMVKNCIKYILINKPMRIIRSSSHHGPKSEELRALRADFKSRSSIF